jgi:hypothetical protein
MTRANRIIAFSLVAAILLTGFAIGRLTQTSSTSAAEEPKLIASTVQPASESTTSEVATNEATTKERDFYLSDFKVGYTDGYNAGATGQNSSVPETSRPGYNDGYKEGYTDSLQAQTKAETPGVRVAGTTRERVVYRTVDRPVYRTVSRPVYVTQRKRGSKLRTALTIAAPAAIGAGIGALFGGKKGAGIGALLGGGGGAIYHLRKNRYRD